ncbi:MAG TPA: helix-turn-helix transcriptional regulator [Microthrixaceae bacterium]|nr:helix-turn-helix transcriptional regulator [Microthrixaceae bacterium]
MAITEIARTIGEWEAEVGRQLRELRLGANRTQEDVASVANVSVSALRSLEQGAGSSLGTLIAVARALGRTDWLEQLAPPVQVSPMEQLKLARKAQARQRQRAGRIRPAAGPEVARIAGPGEALASGHSKAGSG